MSRIAAYLGPSTPVASLVEHGTNSLLTQAHAFPGGFGLGWYPEDARPEPVRLVSRSPIWCEEHLLAVARRFSTRCAVAGVRQTPPGVLVELSGAQPFQRGKYLFIHDGELSLFREVFERPLRQALSDKQHRSLTGNTESELLFATWLDTLGDRHGPEAMADALERMIGHVSKLAQTNGTRASFAVTVSDGTSLVALRTATHGVPPPLHTVVAAAEDPYPVGGRLIASEPSFPGRWAPLEPHSLTIFTGE